jgi:adenosylcobyric acid synthase
METTLTENNTLRNVCGFILGEKTVAKKKVTVKGYEIHAGISQGASLENSLLQLNYSNEAEANGFRDGAISTDDNVMGTYVHGFFDEPSVLDYCFRWLNINTETEHFDYAQYKEAEINRLADEVEKVLPLERILGLFNGQQSELVNE